MVGAFSVLGHFCISFHPFAFGVTCIVRGKTGQHRTEGRGGNNPRASCLLG